MTALPTICSDNPCRLIEKELDARVHEDVERDGRENYLREKLRVIQSELGEDDPWAKELKELKAKIKETNLPEEAETTTLKELDRLYQMPPMSPEVGVIRTYIDWKPVRTSPLRRW